jgi:hypothetical protein
MNTPQYSLIRTTLRPRGDSKLTIYITQESQHTAVNALIFHKSRAQTTFNVDQSFALRFSTHSPTICEIMNRKHGTYLFQILMTFRGNALNVECRVNGTITNSADAIAPLSMPAE